MRPDRDSVATLAKLLQLQGLQTGRAWQGFTEAVEARTEADARLEEATHAVQAARSDLDGAVQGQQLDLDRMVRCQAILLQVIDAQREAADIAERERRAEASAYAVWGEADGRLSLLRERYDRAVKQAGRKRFDRATSLLLERRVATSAKVLA